MDKLAKYKVLNSIGRGNYGSVYLVSDKKSNKPHAMKILPKKRKKSFLSGARLDWEFQDMKQTNMNEKNVSRLSGKRKRKREANIFINKHWLGWRIQKARH